MAQEKRVPIFTLPKIVTALIVLILIVFLVENYLLDVKNRELFLFSFAFIPFLYTPEQFGVANMFTLIFSPFTHALIHSSWEHLLINSAWLAIFGTPVAYRYGAVKFLVIFFISAGFGALAFALSTSPQLIVLVGASGGISGLTGVAIRFIFQPVEVRRDPLSDELIPLGRRLLKLREVIGDQKARFFILIYILLNLFIGLSEYIFELGDFSIAWQAHLGGFFAGLLLAPLFEKKA